jgi:hypothetical protein
LSIPSSYQRESKKLGTETELLGEEVVTPPTVAAEVLSKGVDRLSEGWLGVSGRVAT